MDQVTQLWLIRLIVDLLAIAGVGWLLLRYVRRRLARTDGLLDGFATGAAAREEQIRTMDERVRQLETGQEAMRKEQVAQREILNRISTRLGRQNDLLGELVPTVRDLSTRSIVEQVLAGIDARRVPGTTWHIGEVRGERDAHLGNTINQREGD